MRIITFIFVIVTLSISIWIWNFTSTTRLLYGRMKNAAGQVSSLKEEQGALSGYKSEQGLSLDKFYLEIFNDINEISSYYHIDSEISIVNSKDLVNTEEFFKESRYKGIRYLDLLCRLDLKDKPDTYLFEMLYKILKQKPIEILEVRLDKNNLNLTLRLFGP